MSCKLIQVIECDEARRGSGLRSTDPMRVVRQYWSTDGCLLAEVDPCGLDAEALRKAARSLCDVLRRPGTAVNASIEEYVKHMESVLNGGNDGG